MTTTPRRHRPATAPELYDDFLNPVVNPRRMYDFQLTADGDKWACNHCDHAVNAYSAIRRHLHLVHGITTGMEVRS